MTPAVVLIQNKKDMSAANDLRAASESLENRKESVVTKRKGKGSSCSNWGLPGEGWQGARTRWE